MMKIEIKSQEYKIFDIKDDLVLYTTELNDEISCSFFSAKLKKVGLARNINKTQLKQLLEEMNQNHLREPNLIKVQLIGGDESEQAGKYLEYIIEGLKELDNNTDIINIISLDTCYRLHPNSFEVDGYHGGIRGL